MTTRLTTRLATRLATRPVTMGGGIGPVHTWHPDTANYLTRVETEDGQALEPAIAEAWNVFFHAMDDPDHPTPTAATHKIALAEGTMIPMLGARTLAASLLPLYPDMPSPTNIGFVTGDYDRATGLKGDGISKYVDMALLDSDLPQNDYSYGIFQTEVAGNGQVFIGSGLSPDGASRLGNATASFRDFLHRNRSNSGQGEVGADPIGFTASSRDDSSGYTARTNGTSYSRSFGSQTPTGLSVFAFATNNNGSPHFFCSARQIMPYACRSVDLAYMDSCLTTLQSSIAAALA